MRLLVVGSMAFDSIRSPIGEVERVVGGSATYFSLTATFLGNIAPALQLDILRLVRRPKLVALDTMNYWIESSPGPLREVIGKVDILMVNEGEVRMLTGEYNLVKAARRVIGWGPSRVVIKRGEYGVLHLSDGTMFAAPA